MSKCLWNGANLETGLPSADAVSINPETWGGVRLVVVTTWNGDRSQDVFLTESDAADLGRALIGPDTSDDDTCDPWVHRDTPLDPDWISDAMAELDDPRATSRGHRRTIGACRLLVDEVARLRSVVDAVWMEASISKPTKEEPESSLLETKNVRLSADVAMHNGIGYGSAFGVTKQEIKEAGPGTWRVIGLWVVDGGDVVIRVTR